MDTRLMRARKAATDTIRTFFDRRDHLEVETPTLSPDLIPEVHIESFATRHIDPYGLDRELYLIPSPEVFMKKLIAQGSGSIYQICKSFRNSEQRGNLHNPEFTMLEWYSVGVASAENIDITFELLQAVADEVESIGFQVPARIREPFETCTMDEVFRRHAGVPLSDCPTSEDLAREAPDIDLDPGASWEENFHRIFLTEVEPALPQDRGTVITHYPAAIPCLAAPVAGTPWLDRWELFLGGIELANCYTEETDPNRVHEYYRREAEALAADPLRLTWPASDPHYHEHFEGFPACSGVAMGVDRLLMAVTGVDDIGQVLTFPL